MAFWNKKPVNSEEYEKLSKRIIELSVKIEELSKKFELLTTDMANLRGRFNQKLSKIKKDDGEIETEESKSLNNPMLLTDNGAFIKNW